MFGCDSFSLRGWLLGAGSQATSWGKFRRYPDGLTSTNLKKFRKKIPHDRCVTLAYADENRASPHNVRTKNPHSMRVRQIAQLSYPMHSVDNPGKSPRTTCAPFLDNVCFARRTARVIRVPHASCTRDPRSYCIRSLMTLHGFTALSTERVDAC